MVDQPLMRVCGFQESKETPDPATSQNSAQRNQRFLRGVTHMNCECESPYCK